MEYEKPRLTKQSLSLRIILGIIVAFSTVVRGVMYIRVGIRRVLHWVGIIPELGTLEEEMTFGFMKPMLDSEMAVGVVDDDDWEDLAA